MTEPDFTTDPIRDNELSIIELDMILKGIIDQNSVMLSAQAIADTAAKAGDPVRELRDSLIRVVLTTTLIVSTMDAKSKRQIVQQLQQGQLLLRTENIVRNSEKSL